MKITLQQAQELDKILEYLIKTDDFADAKRLNTEIFPDHIETDIEGLLSILTQNHTDLVVQSSATYYIEIKAKPNTQVFLKNGGFTTQFKTKSKKEQQEQKYHNLEIKQMQSDIALTKRKLKDYKCTKAISIIALIISFIVLIIELLRCFF